MKKISILSLFFLVLIGFSCDKIDESYIGEVEPVDTKGSALLFEFTGHTCGNCPEGHKKAEELKEIYGNSLIVISVHAGYFAEPKKADKYTYDFRSQAGNELYKSIGEPPTPVGLVGNLSKNELSNYADWGGKLTPILDTEATIDAKISNEFSESDKKLKINLNIKSSKEENRKLKLAVYIIEDKIINWQKNYKNDPVDISDYEHKHVLRGSVNGTWGEALKQGIAANETIKKEYNFTLGSDWKAENCEVIAFVYDDSTKEIIEVNHAAVIAE